MDSRESFLFGWDVDFGGSLRSNVRDKVLGLG